MHDLQLFHSPSPFKPIVSRTTRTNFYWLASRIPVNANSASSYTINESQHTLYLLKSLHVLSATSQPFWIQSMLLSHHISHVHPVHVTLFWPFCPPNSILQISRQLTTVLCLLFWFLIHILTQIFQTSLWYTLHGRFYIKIAPSGEHKLVHTPNLIEDAPYNIYRHRTVDYTPTLDLGPSSQALP